MSFRTHDDSRPSKFVVLADNRKEAIYKAWEHGGADFQSRFDKSTAQALEMKAGALRVCNDWKAKGSRDKSDDTLHSTHGLILRHLTTQAIG